MCSLQSGNRFPLHKLLELVISSAVGKFAALYCRINVPICPHLIQFCSSRLLLYTDEEKQPELFSENIPAPFIFREMVNHSIMTTAARLRVHRELF